MSNPGKITSALFSPRKLGGTGHLPPAEKKRLREERAARRVQAVAMAKADAAGRAKYAKPDGANRQTDPVDPGFAAPSNAADIEPPKPGRAKAAK
jgi:hypothetical protein